VHRTEGDSQKTPYKYQEQELRNGFKEKGFAALDDLLRYLEANVATFTNFASSPNYTIAKAQIVRATSEIDDVYYINRSRIIFLRLLPHLRTVEKTIIAPRLGDIYTDMIASLTSESPDAKYTSLREKLIPVVVLYAVSRLIRETGSITDRGLFFETKQNSDDATRTQVASNEAISAQATMAEGDAISYWMLAEKYLKTELQYSTSTGSRIPTRDNNNKKAFWA
jgi:hypothetical protein